jgi:hypothetical protein
MPTGDRRQILIWSVYFICIPYFIFVITLLNVLLCSDFRFYEDGSDEFRDVEGTLLPLWKFEYEKAKVKKSLKI